LRQEDFIADPKHEVQRLFDYLELPTSKKLKKTVAERLYEAPQKTRFRVDAFESAENRSRVEALIAKHDFFSGYSYES